MAPPPPAEIPTIITLRIKVPPGHIEGAADEFTLGSDVAVSSRIGDIRARIQQLVPSNPPPERQRLLYAGRALVDDEQTLSDALNIRRDPTQTEFVVHLLVKGDSTAAATGPRARLQNTGPAPAAAGLPHENTEQTGRVGTPSARDVLQQQQQVQQQLLQVQQQQARLVALHHAQHHAADLPSIFTAGQEQPGQLDPGMMQMPQHFDHHHGLHGLPELPPQIAANLPGFRPPQAHGALHTHPVPPPGQTDQHQRSTSQPPPGPHGQGVVLEGRGPNGERFHFQQHIQMGLQPLLPGYGIPHMPLFGQQQQVPRRNGPSAVEQARDNLAEIRRVLDELRGLDGSTEEQRTRIDRLQQQIQQVNNFVDPFSLGGSTAPAANPLHTFSSARGITVPRASSQPPPMQYTARHMPPGNQPATSTGTSADVTCYLLSSPTGPQALLYSPQHGTYTGGMSPIVQQSTRTTQPALAAANEQLPPNQAQAVAAQPIVAQAAAAPADNLGAFGPVINHMWLLLRVMIFAYFILGANLGWRRPLAMLAIAIGFWLLRQGPLGEGGVLRRWWDGIVNQGQQRAVPGQQEGQAQVRPGQMPTPAQVAQRLLEEERQQRVHGLSWLREQIRPAERALALLVASLWPGVGEAYVRALEAEERRRNEEEVAARRREEEERQKREEEEKTKADEAASSADKAVEAAPSTEADESEKKDTAAQDSVAPT